jgi:hypothetical protein
MSEITDVSTAEVKTEYRGPGRPPKTAQVERQPVKPPDTFVPYTFADIAINRVGDVLAQISIKTEYGQERLSTLEQVASLDRYRAQTGRDIDSPYNTLALLLGARGTGRHRKTGQQRAREVIETAKRMIAANHERMRF